MRRWFNLHGKEFLYNIWGRCQSRIMKTLGNYWFVPTNSVYKAKNVWGTGVLTSPLMDDLSPLSADQKT